jgi:hypothetical protein
MFVLRIIMGHTMKKSTKTITTILASTLTLLGVSIILKKANNKFFTKKLKPNDLWFKKDPNSDIDWSRI